MIATATLVLSDVWGFHHDDVGVGWGLVMMLIMVIFWGLVIYGVIALIRGGLAGDRREPDDPGEILKRRLAAGEITVEEYERRRAVIEAGASGDPPPGKPAAGGSS